MVCWHTGSRAGLVLLCQVEGAQELPAPDAQSEAKARELPDVCAVVGDYIVRCFCSKVIAFRGRLEYIGLTLELPRQTWGLRDAALQKIQLELNNYTQPPGTVLSAVCQLLQLAATYDRLGECDARACVCVCVLTSGA